VNEDDLNALEPIPWYRRPRIWLFVGLPVLIVLLSVLGGE
jgi:hypothetical protein